MSSTQPSVRNLVASQWRRQLTPIAAEGARDVAQMSSQTGLTTITRTDHAVYLAGWLRILGSDARALVTVASRAQAAVDWLNTHTGHTTAETVEEVAA